MYWQRPNSSYTLLGSSSTRVNWSHRGLEDAIRMTAEQGILDTQGVEALAALERFVVDNDDLLALESLIGKFNIFV